MDKRKLLLIFVALVYSCCAIAGNKASAMSGNWNSEATWGNVVIPTNGDNVTISTGHTVTINITDAEAKSITVQSGATLIINGYLDVITSFTSYNNGIVIINSSGAFQVTDFVLEESSEITVDGELNVINTLTNNGSDNIDGDGVIETSCTNCGVPPDLRVDNQFTGTTSSAWNVATNWSDGTVPASSESVSIKSSATNFPVISTTVTVDSMEVRGGQTLTVTGSLNVTLLEVISDASTSGSFIASGSGTFSGSLSYGRYVTGGSLWHLISAPATGQDLWTLAMDSENDIENRSSDGAVAIVGYDESADRFKDFYTADPSVTLESGKGFEVLRSTDGLISINGGLRATDLSVTLARSGFGWNLLGNPFPSAVRATSGGTTDYLLNSTNVANIDQYFAALYLWDASSESYKIINNSGATNPEGTLAQDYIQAGQGFFVRSKHGGGSFNIEKDMQEHQTGTAFKSSEKAWPTILLTAECGENKSSTLITFNQNMTNGLDVTYDAGMFKSNPDFALYSRLLEDNGIDFGIQCLPEEYDELVIPVGLDGMEGTIVTFRAEVENLPDKASCYLEDKNSKTCTRLDVSNACYSVALNTDNLKTGNFFIHTSKTHLGIYENVLSDEELKFYLTEDGSRYLNIEGEINQGSVLKIYDLSGRLRKQVVLNNTANNRLKISDLTSGIYVIQVKDGNHMINKKMHF